MSYVLLYVVSWFLPSTANPISPQETIKIWSELHDVDDSLNIVYYKQVWMDTESYIMKDLCQMFVFVNTSMDYNTQKYAGVATMSKSS